MSESGSIFSSELWMAMAVSEMYEYGGFCSLYELLPGRGMTAIPRALRSGAQSCSHALLRAITGISKFLLNFTNCRNVSKTISKKNPLMLGSCGRRFAGTRHLSLKSLFTKTPTSRFVPHASGNLFSTFGFAFTLPVSGAHGSQTSCSMQRLVSVLPHLLRAAFVLTATSGTPYRCTRYCTLVQGSGEERGS